MAEKRYFWLRLYDDFFSSKRIKKLRSIAGGDTYTIIYLKMQLKALKTDGYLYFDGVMEDFAEELALDIDENPDNVKVTINFLLANGLLETSDGEQYKLPYLDKCIGSENASTQRVRDYRTRQKALQCNANVTEVKRYGNAEIELEIEKELEKDIEKELDIYESIRSLYHSYCKSYPHCPSLTETHKERIDYLMQTYNLGDFVTMFKKAEASRFLKGENDRKWSACLGWMIKDNNMQKILNGEYDQ